MVSKGNHPQMAQLFWLVIFLNFTQITNLELAEKTLSKELGEHIWTCYCITPTVDPIAIVE